MPLLTLVETFAQEEPAPVTSTLSVNVQVVAFDAVVHNPDGQLVLDLGKDAFTLKVDGKPTAIRYFNRDNDLPLTIGLMIDTSGSQRVYFDEEALNSETFLTNILTNPKDRALIACFDSRIDLLQKMTTRLNELHNALRRLDYRDPEKGPGATRLYDSIAALSKSVTSPEAGRRALVILTDGDDNGSQTSRSEAIREAQLAGVAIYGVLYTHDVIGGVPYPSSASLRPSGIAVMREISRHRRPCLRRQYRHADRRDICRDRTRPSFAISLRIHASGIEAGKIPPHRTPHRRQTPDDPGAERVLHAGVASHHPSPR